MRHSSDDAMRDGEDLFAEEPPRDQLLAFLDGDELQPCRDLCTSSAELEELDRLAAAYRNACNAVAFHNDMIASLLAQLEPPVAADVRNHRASLVAGWLPTSITGSPKAAVKHELAPDAPLDAAALACLKLDVSDRLAKRHFAERTRRSLLADLVPRINALRMRLLVDAAERSCGKAPSMVTRHAGAGATAAPVKRRVYSDAEVKARLRKAE